MALERSCGVRVVVERVGVERVGVEWVGVEVRVDVGVRVGVEACCGS